MEAGKIEKEEKLFFVHRVVVRPGLPLVEATSLGGGYVTVRSSLLWPARGYLPCAAASLRPPSVVLDLVDGPHGALHILHPHEALVEAQVVPDGVLTNNKNTDD